MTAVEWLVEQILNNKGARVISVSTFYIKDEIVEQAKELEKQQTINFTNDFIDEYTYGDYNGMVQMSKTVKQYYKEKFKNK